MPEIDLGKNAAAAYARGGERPRSGGRGRAGRMEINSKPGTVCKRQKEKSGEEMGLSREGKGSRSVNGLGGRNGKNGGGGFEEKEGADPHQASNHLPQGESGTKKEAL